MQEPEQRINKSLRSIQETYNEIAAEFDITRYKPWPQTVEFIDELPDNSTVLDLGCGNGRNIMYLPSLKRGFRIFGLDFSIHLLRIAKEKIKDLGLEHIIEFILGDVIQLPFPSSSLDGIIYVATLHHLPTADQRLASLLDLERCLRSKGRAFISVWDFEQDRFTDELKKQLKNPPTDREFGDVLVPWTGKRGSAHHRFYHLFYKDEFEKLLGQTSLEIKKLFRAADNYHAVVEKP
jgi:ubiquinone/menaquinone biosynthesis C-methylase UbiE